MKFLDWDDWWKIAKHGRAVPWCPFPNDPKVRKLNLGSGSLVYDPDKGWTNVDLQEGPGIVNFDIFHKPWPLESDTFDYVHMSNILEHVPQEKFFIVLEELFRISKDGAHWEVLGPDPRNVLITLQSPGHTTLVGPWTFHGFCHPVRQGALDIGYATQANRLEPVDHVVDPEGHGRYVAWYGFKFGRLTDWHARRYLGRRIGDLVARVLGRPWTLRLVYRIVKS